MVQIKTFRCQFIVCILGIAGSHNLSVVCMMTPEGWRTDFHDMFRAWFILQLHLFLVSFLFKYWIANCRQETPAGVVPVSLLYFIYIINQRGRWLWLSRRGVGMGSWGKQVGSMDEEPQVRGCYNFYLSTNQPGNSVGSPLNTGCNSKQSTCLCRDTGGKGTLPAQHTTFNTLDNWAIPPPPPPHPIKKEKDRKEKVIGSWPGTCIQYTRLHIYLLF